MEKIAFVFPGQGTHYVGMSRAFYEQFPIARDTFEEANDVLGFDLKKLCFEGSLGELSAAKNAHAAIFITSIIAFRVYMKEIGICPQICAGHSLGEYSALTCSGAMRFPDALKIVYQRSLIAQEIADEGNMGMTIIDGIDSGRVEEECKNLSTEYDMAAISCYNGSKQVAVSGHLDAVQKVEDRVLELGGQITPLIGSAPFHCQLMKPAAERLKVELEKYSYGSIRYPVVSNLSGKPYSGSEEIVGSLMGQIMNPVQWTKIMGYFKRFGVTLVIEMGPQNILGKLLKTDMDRISTLCFDHKKDRQDLYAMFHQPRYRKLVPTVVTGCLTAASATPSNNWNETEYQKGVVEPYRKLQKIQNELEKAQAEPTMEQMKEAIEMLGLIFQSKKLPLDEQEKWFNRIYDESGTQYIFGGGHSR